MKYILLGLLMFATSFSFAQLEIEWTKNFGGSNRDWVYSIINTSDEGFLIAARSESDDGDVSTNFGGIDCWIIKLDLEGNIIWERNFGGSDNDIASDIIESKDGGYIVTGWSTSQDGQLTSNNGLNDIWVFKIDINGNLLWQQSFGGSDNEISNKIIETVENEILITGWTYSNDGDFDLNQGSRDIFLLKLDETGSLIWQKTYGGPSSDVGITIDQMNDGTYILIGGTGGGFPNFHGNRDILILKLDTSGNIEQSECYGGSGYDSPYSVSLLEDGDLLIGAVSSSNDHDVLSNNGNQDFWILQLNNEGEILFTKNYGGTEDEDYTQVQPKTDGGIIALGWSESDNIDVNENRGDVDIWMIELNQEGDIIWQNIFGGMKTDRIRSFIQTNDGGYIFAAESESNDEHVPGNNGGTDLLITKFNPIITNTTNHTFLNEISIFPNPTHSSFRIESLNEISDIIITISNLKGEILKSISQYKNEIQIDHLPNGTYFITIQSNDYTMTRKIVLKK